MTGTFGVSCQNCGERVLLDAPHLVDAGQVIDEDDYRQNATLRGTCINCHTVVSTIGPIVVRDGPRSYAILSLPGGQPIPGEALESIVRDLLDMLPPQHRDNLGLYATHEEFLLERARPDIYHGVELDEVLRRDVTAELTMIEDVANSTQEAGEPLLALEHIHRILRYVPDLGRDRSFKENVALLRALAEAKEPNNPRIAELGRNLDRYMVEGSDLGRAQVTWRVAYAFGPDAPLIRGVPAGYIVPSMYVDSGQLSPDERVVVSFLILLFSSACRRLAAHPRDDQLLMHSLATQQFTQRWTGASGQCRSYIEEFYLEVSGRSLVEDLDLERR